MPETTHFTGMEGDNTSDSALKANFVLHNRYKIMGVLGGGGMGTVYQARDLNFTDVRKLVAIKEMQTIATDAALIAHDNRAYWESFEERPGGAVLVTFAAPDLETAASIVLRHGFPATIVEPAELRDLVRERASALAAYYAAAE